MMMGKWEDHKDLDRREALIRANGWASRGWNVYFKYTCEKCGERCTLAEANLLTEYGECYECGHETKLEKVGFLLASKGLT
jgi:DNA-directed RNA polymerase subunit RPC12/RpoP